MTWQVALILLGVLSSAGALADRLLLRRHKHGLYANLVRWWCRLDEIQFRELAREMARMALERTGFARVAGVRFIRRTLSVGVPVSLVLTVAAHLGGSAIDGGTAAEWTWSLPSLPVLVINASWDVLTLGITIVLLRVVRDKGAVTALLAVAGDVVVACAIGCACVTSLVLASDATLTGGFRGSVPVAHSVEKRHYLERGTLRFDERVNIRPRDYELNGRSTLMLELYEPAPDEGDTVWFVPGGGIHEHLMSAPAALVRKIRDGSASYDATAYVFWGGENGPAGGTRCACRYSLGWTMLLLTGTALVPTTAYIGFLGVLALAKLCLVILRRGAMYVLEAATDLRSPAEFAPFTLLGLLMGTALVAAKALASLVSLA